LLKGGLVYSDYLTTVSRRYAQEIQTPELGYGLDGVVRSRADRIVGILNGVDYTAWNPAKDSLIAAKYSAKDLSGKQLCKQDLLQLYGLSTDNPHRPLMGIVSRFADQKGFDMIADRAHEILREDVMLVVWEQATAVTKTCFAHWPAPTRVALDSSSPTTTWWRTKSRPARTFS
jgi:starch synthase